MAEARLGSERCVSRADRRPPPPPPPSPTEPPSQTSLGRVPRLTPLPFPALPSPLSPRKGARARGRRSNRPPTNRAVATNAAGSLASWKLLNVTRARRERHRSATTSSASPVDSPELWDMLLHNDKVLYNEQSATSSTAPSTSSPIDARCATVQKHPERDPPPATSSQTSYAAAGDDAQALVDAGAAISARTRNRAKGALPGGRRVRGGGGGGRGGHVSRG